MQALLAKDLLEEEVRDHALAHEASLQVGEHAQDGVDLTCVGELLELFRAQRSGRAGHVGPPFGSGALSKNRRCRLSNANGGPEHGPAVRTDVLVR
jgi:hypothetical protein